MPIPVEIRQVEFIKQLTDLRFSRDLRTNEFRIAVEYSVGFVDDEGAFHITDTDHQLHTGLAALWILDLRGSQGVIEDPTLAQMFTQIFDGIETGQVAPPQPEFTDPDA